MLALFLTLLGSATEQPKATEIASITATAEYRPLVAEFARCVARRNRAGSSDFVLRKNIEWTKSGGRAVRKLIHESCVPSQATQEQAQTLLKITPDIWRPYIADALVGIEFPVSDANIIRTAQPLPTGDLVDILWPTDCDECDAKRRVKVDEARARAAALMMPYIFGECAVRADPDNSYQLLVTLVDSAGETSALSALAPAFSQCVEAGSKINSNPTVLRGLVAISYYRLAHAPRVAAVQGASK